MIRIVPCRNEPTRYDLPHITTSRFMTNNTIYPGMRIECECYNTSGVVLYFTHDDKVTWRDEDGHLWTTAVQPLTYVPSTFEVQMAMAEIRKSWTATDRKKRSQWRPQRVTFDPVEYLP